MSDPWDKMVLDEADLLMKWSGLGCKLIHSSDGTAAVGYYDQASGVLSGLEVHVDKAELMGFFVGFDDERLRTAVFFALAHEFGHLLQYSVLGVAETNGRPSKLIEGHADYLSGVWLGLRLAGGDDHESDAVLAAGLALKGSSDDYPTPYQRGRLVQDAMGTAVLLAHIVDPQIGDDDYEPASAAITATDVHDCYGIVERHLREIPREAP